MFGWHICTQHSHSKLHPKTHKRLLWWTKESFEIWTHCCWKSLQFSLLFSERIRVQGDVVLQPIWTQWACLIVVVPTTWPQITILALPSTSITKWLLVPTVVHLRSSSWTAMEAIKPELCMQNKAQHVYCFKMLKLGPVLRWYLKHLRPAWQKHHQKPR